jgi:hypothetical protein
MMMIVAALLMLLHKFSNKLSAPLKKYQAGSISFLMLCKLFSFLPINKINPNVYLWT